MKKILSLLLLSFLFIASCKKYPDGPSFSLRSPTQRLIGAWGLKTYTVDGVDSINIFSNYTLLPGMDFKDPAVTDTAGYIIRGGMDSSNYVTNLGLYALQNKKTELQLTSSLLVNQLNLSGPLMSNVAITYKILRLKKSELWLQTDFNGKSYELHYEKKK